MIRKLIKLVLLIGTCHILWAQPAIPSLTYRGQFGGSFYYLSNSALDWGDADRFCKQAGGHLACIGSATENAALAGMILPDVWIGFNDYAVNGEGNFQWVTGEPIVYTHWQAGQPDNSATRQDFARLLQSGFWDDWYGVDAQRFLLEISFDAPQLVYPVGNEIWRIGQTVPIHWYANPAFTDVTIEVNRDYSSGVWETLLVSTPNDGTQTLIISGSVTSNAKFRVRSTSGDLIGLSIGYVTIQRSLTGFVLLGTFGGHEYYVSTSFIDWYSARSSCVAAGGHLLTINSPEENDFIYSNLADDLWTGLNDISVEGHFVWESGEPVVFTDWAPGRPDNAGNQDAVMNTWLTIGAGWDDHYTSQYSRYVLELVPVDEGPADPGVQLIPDNPDFPGQQNTRACATLSETEETVIAVLVSDETNVPLVHISSGCLNCDELTCPPLNQWVFDVNGWQFADNPPRFVNTISAAPGSNGSCVCISLDYVLPVELTEFNAVGHENDVTLRWVTASETNVDHFELMKDGLTAGYVQAENSATGHDYTWMDLNAEFGQIYEYKLVCVDFGGDRAEIGSLESGLGQSSAVIDEFSMHPAYPNPFNPSTSISFDLAEASNVKFRVFNVIGEEVAFINLGMMQVGTHKFEWNASALASGIYFGKIEAGALTATQKLVLMK